MKFEKYLRRKTDRLDHLKVATSIFVCFDVRKHCRRNWLRSTRLLHGCSWGTYCKIAAPVSLLFIRKRTLAKSTSILASDFDLELKTALFAWFNSSSVTLLLEVKEERSRWVVITGRSRSNDICDSNNLQSHNKLLRRVSSEGLSPYPWESQEEPSSSRRAFWQLDRASFKIAFFFV